MSSKAGYVKLSKGQEKSWGDVILETLYIMALNYKDSPENRKAFGDYVSSMAILLPDLNYRTVFRSKLKNSTFFINHFEDREKMISWAERVVSSTAFQVRKYYLLPTEKSYGGGKLFWGRKIWATMHLYAANFNPSENSKKAFIKFITSLAYILPCDECRKHYIINLKNHPLKDSDFESAEKLYTWTFQLHKIVNDQLGKNTPSFEESKKMWRLK